MFCCLLKALRCWSLGYFHGQMVRDMRNMHMPEWCHRYHSVVGLERNIPTPDSDLYLSAFWQGFTSPA